jgi:hypothetical protein
MELGICEGRPLFMKMCWLGFGALLFTVSVVSVASIGEKQRDALTMQSACGRLRTVISKRLGASHGPDQYRCEDAATGVNGYYVFALRSNYPAPKGAAPDWVGSGLVGWYAVRVTDGQVQDWDVANLKPGAIIK